MQRVLCVFENI